MEKERIKQILTFIALFFIAGVMTFSIIYYSVSFFGSQNLRITFSITTALIGLIILYILVDEFRKYYKVKHYLT